MLTSLLQPQSQPSWATHFLSCHAAVLPSLVYTAPQACKDTSCLTKWHLGVMMESDRLAFCFLTSPHLRSIKEPGIQNLKMVVWSH